jgi:type IV pilus assembly protein PilC
LYPISVTAIDDGNEEVLAEDDIRLQLQHLQPFTVSKKVFIFRQLALLLASGITLTEAIDLVANMQNGRVKALLRDINHDIQSGSSFSVALSKHEKLFTRMAVQMVLSAEASGELSLTLERIADHLERRAELTSQVINTLIYPVVTLLMAVGVFFFLVTGVVPKFATFFAKTGRSIPAEMQSMIDISDFILNQWLLLSIFSIISITLFIMLYRNERGRYWIDSGLLKIPLIGGVISTGAMSQYSWSIASLLKSGLPVVETMQISAGLINNRVISNDILNISEQILQGQPLSQAVKQSTISRLIQHMTLVGERSGGLVDIMFKAGVYYENELKSKAKAIGSMVEPVSIILIGGLVGFIYFGFFKAIFSISAQ